MGFSLQAFMGGGCWVYEERLMLCQQQQVFDMEPSEIWVWQLPSKQGRQALAFRLVAAIQLCCGGTESPLLSSPWLTVAAFYIVPAPSTKIAWVVILSGPWAVLLNRLVGNPFFSSCVNCQLQHKLGWYFFTKKKKHTHYCQYILGKATNDMNYHMLSI